MVMQFFSLSSSTTFLLKSQKYLTMVLSEYCLFMKERLKPRLHKPDQQNSFKLIRSTVITKVNIFLQTVQKSATNLSMERQFSRGNINAHFSGFSTNHEVIGMLEASNIEQTDMVAFSLAAIINHFWKVRSAGTTVLFRRYVDIIRIVFRVYKSAKLSTTRDIGLKTFVRDVKQCAKRAFQNCQSTKLCASKFRALDHLTDNVVEMSLIHSLDCFPYTRSHKTFNECYRNTSKRRHLSIKETLNIFQESRKQPALTLKEKISLTKKTHGRALQ